MRIIPVQAGSGAMSRGVTREEPEGHLPRASYQGGRNSASECCTSRSTMAEQKTRVGQSFPADFCLLPSCGRPQHSEVCLNSVEGKINWDAAVERTGAAATCEAATTTALLGSDISVT